MELFTFGNFVLCEHCHLLPCNPVFVGESIGINFIMFLVSVVCIKSYHCKIVFMVSLNVKEAHSLKLFERRQIPHGTEYLLPIIRLFFKSCENPVTCPVARLTF